MLESVSGLIKDKLMEIYNGPTPCLVKVIDLTRLRPMFLEIMLKENDHCATKMFVEFVYHKLQDI